MHGDGWVGKHSVGHGGTGPQPFRAHDQMHMAAVFREINSLFAGGITATDNSQFGVAKLGCRSITNGTSTNATAPKLLF